MQRMMLLVLLSVAGCDDANTSDADVEALTTRVAELETLVADLQTSLGEAVAEIEAHRETALAAEELLTLVSVSDADDVVIEGANLRVLNGNGGTYVRGGGKGNVIIGYDEPRNVGLCNLGTNDGTVCTGDNDCEGGGVCQDAGVCGGGSNDGTACTSNDECLGGGVCLLGETMQRSGSHNLIVGDEHVYRSDGAVVVGLANTATHNRGFVAGSRNVVSGAGATVSGGHENTAWGVESAVSGGVDNAAEASAATVAGGEGNTASVARSLVP